MPAHASGSDQVRAFLQAMQERNLPLAKSYLAEGFEMVFPGGKTMRQLEELVAWGALRYQRVAKTYERFDEVSLAENHCIVYCYGYLYGLWLDGKPFDAIRFIDRFEVRDGRFVRQDVWNDLAESKLAL